MMHQNVPHPRFLALLAIADAYLNTSLREGMRSVRTALAAALTFASLSAHEFLFMTGTSRRYAVLLISEFCGTKRATQFDAALELNPFDSKSVADAIHRALSMPPAESEKRWRELNAHMGRQTARGWSVTLPHAIDWP